MCMLDINTVLYCRLEIFAVEIFSSVSGMTKIKCAKNLNAYMHYIAEPSSDEIFTRNKKH